MKNDMNTQVPKLKIQNGELEIEGDFDFKLSPTTITDDFIAIKKVTFDWCIEISPAEFAFFGEDNIMEMFGEKLKQDFIKFSKNNSQ